MIIAGRVLFGVVLATAVSAVAVAQDTVQATPPRHVLTLDTTRLQPYRRYFDLAVHGANSASVIGVAETVFAPATYAGAPAWLLVESRSGAVPSAESLYVAPDLRPLHWSSSLGPARLGTAFVGDSIYGAVTGPSGKQNIVLAGRPDLVVSTPMLSMLLPLLPLTTGWSDSVHVMAVDLSTSRVVAARLAVVGEQDLALEPELTRPAWLVELQAEGRTVQFWVDKEIPAVLRVVQALPPHVGRLLEYRLRAAPESRVSAAPP